MDLFKLDIDVENIVMRAIACIILIMFNINLKGDEFYIILYILTGCIFTLTQEISKNINIKKLMCVLNFISGIIFLFSGFRVCAIVLIVLILEMLVQIKFGEILSIIIMVVSVLAVNINSIDKIIYIVTILNTVYILKSLKYTKEKLRMERKENDILRDKLYLKVKKFNDYIEFSNQNVKMAKLEERNEIGRKMHDKIGHVIAGSLMRLEAAKIVLNSNQEKGIEMIDESISNLRTGINDIREIIHKITPKNEELGVSRIKNILKDKLLNSSINLMFNVEGDIKNVSSNNWIIIENIVVELSTNSLKYSKCKNIEVKIQVLNKIVRISFKDDGIGCKNFKAGFGLKKIEDEVVRNGGLIIINSDIGFEVIVSLKI
ncbi:sensor histidine kinase [Clostridium thermobutyricum]|uniref:histidine kinase n=1 Tax=Clostridium thermobutyricum DSM 4928 TaxID=1121339 RepID=A0A1V4SV84_9CLOT|nr:histidine kinase [Clostridium thermobutyricum]OPX47137.1 sensor histidine kinase DesK [Clostridium thermobutyricum DSM 4928]